MVFMIIVVDSRESRLLGVTVNLTVNLLKKRNKRARNRKENKIPASYKLNRHQFTNDCLYNSYLHCGKVYDWLLRKEYCKALTDGRRLLMQWVGCCILVGPFLVGLTMAALSVEEYSHDRRNTFRLISIEKAIVESNLHQVVSLFIVTWRHRSPSRDHSNESYAISWQPTVCSSTS